MVSKFTCGTKYQSPVTRGLLVSFSFSFLVDSIFTGVPLFRRRFISTFPLQPGDVCPTGDKQKWWAELPGKSRKGKGLLRFPPPSQLQCERGSRSLSSLLAPEGKPRAQGRAAAGAWCQARVPAAVESLPLGVFISEKLAYCFIRPLSFWI